MFYKNVATEKEVLINHIEELLDSVQIISFYIDTDLPLCKKHSAIYSAHADFDYKLMFLKSSLKDTSLAELFNILDDINVYLIWIINKRFYNPANIVKLNEYLNTAKYLLKN